jgi:putative tryptophan/tyrosine transport system substrate-binding protein
MPVIGYMEAGSAEPNAPFLAAFRKGLSETGYVEGRNPPKPALGQKPPPAL